MVLGFLLQNPNCYLPSNPMDLLCIGLLNIVFAIVYAILYIKATVVSVCLSVRAVSRHYPDRQTNTTVVCFVKGGGPRVS